MFNNQIIAGSSGQGGGSFYDFTIDNSVRMSDASNSQLYWQAGTASSDYVWTMSLWMKKYDPAGGQASNEFFSAGPNGVNYMFISMNSNQRFYYNQYGSQNLYWGSGRQFRDPNAWFHLVLQANSQEATQADRLKLWLNGVNITSEASETSISTSVFPYINQSGYNQYYGGASGVANGNPGCNYYLADINFCDGQSYDASYFGEFKNGIWVPIDPSVTYGNNGYRLEFKQTGTSADASGIGADTSGNGNHFTVAGVTAHDVVTDSPTNSFCTLNPLTHGTYPTLKEGNLSIATVYSADLSGVASTWYPTTGKWYWEVHNENAASTYPYLGITDQRYTNWNATKGTYFGVAWLRTGTSASSTNYMGTITKNNVTSWTNNDIIMFALDVDARKLWVGKNGTWDGSGDPAAGTGEDASWTDDTGVSPMLMGYSGQGVDCVFNFGQDGTFAGNQTAQGNADENGVGDFYYAPPSGFLAMATSNIADGNIGPNSTTTSDQHFNTVLWTGDGTTGRSITSVNFSPNFVWTKGRSGARQHLLFDTIRGNGAYLLSTSTNAEATDTNTLTTFDSDGFTIGSNININTNTETYVGWNWKAGGIAVSNTNGSITSSVSANPDAGFSIVTYSGTLSSAGTASVGHGLSSRPEMVISKSRNVSGADAGDWAVWHDYLSTDNHILRFDTAAESNKSGNGDMSSLFTTTTFGTNYTSGLNVTGNNYVAYCFHSVEGHLKCGSYVGNNSANGIFVYTGFRPAFVIAKSVSVTGNWCMFDNTRDAYNDGDLDMFYANSTLAESAFAVSATDLLSNGFKIRHTTSDGYFNVSGATYIYLAFAEAPAKYSNAR